MSRYSNLIQVIKSKTAQGFIGNFASAGQKSLDRTEPMIGAKVTDRRSPYQTDPPHPPQRCLIVAPPNPIQKRLFAHNIIKQVLLEIYKKHRDAWVVELLINDLIDWHNWFATYRILAPKGLVCLGSSAVHGG